MLTWKSIPLTVAAQVFSLLRSKKKLYFFVTIPAVESSWNVMAHGDAREGKWNGNWRMEWIASTLHTISEHGASSITTADAETSTASSRLNWRPCRFKWTRPFRREKKSGFCACAITFQKQSTSQISTLFSTRFTSGTNGYCLGTLRAIQFFYRFTSKKCSLASPLYLSLFKDTEGLVLLGE